MRRIPEDIAYEAVEQIKRDSFIYADDLAAKLKTAGVSRPIEVLEEQDCRRAAQQWIASFRDADGNRAIMAVREPETRRIKYQLVDACNDPAMLQEMRHGLNQQIQGLKGSVKKIELRESVVAKVWSVLEKAVLKRGKK